MTIVLSTSIVAGHGSDNLRLLAKCTIRGWTRVDREDRGEVGGWGVHVPFYSFEIDRLRTTLLAHTLALSIHAVVRLHTVAYRARSPSPSSSFYQFLSFSLSRRSSFAAGFHSSAAFLGTRAEVLVGASACNLSISMRP